MFSTGVLAPERVLPRVHSPGIVEPASHLLVVFYVSHGGEVCCLGPVHAVLGGRGQGFLRRRKYYYCVQTKKCTRGKKNIT